jgi:hypothetical protein
VLLDIDINVLLDGDGCDCSVADVCRLYARACKPAHTSVHVT